MVFKKSLEFYKSSLKPSFTSKICLCRVDLLFRKEIVPNIERMNISEKKKSFSLKTYCIHFFLALFSLFNIVRLRFKNMKTAQYLIDIKNSDDDYDFRSKSILEVVLPKESINFMHINSLKYSLYSILKKNNVIYFESIYEMLRPFLKKQKFEYEQSESDFVNHLLEIHQNNYSNSYYIYKITKMILAFLNIKKFICLDDSRYSNELNISCNELKIETIGYMHGRFNEYHLGLFEFKYDKYLVWSEYFKKKLLDQSGIYKEKNIEVIGHLRVKKELNHVNKGKNILWVGESNIAYAELFPFINNILDCGYNLIFRGKPGSNQEIDKFLEEKKILIDTSGTFFESLQTNQVSLVIGTHSTALMESWLVSVPSLAINCSYDYGSHLWEDNLIELCENDNEICNYVDKYLSISCNEVNRIKEKIWGINCVYNKQQVRKSLLG